VYSDIQGGSVTDHEARELLHEFTASDSLRKHAYAVSAALRAYAPTLGGDPEEWGVVGILHDFDYEKHPTYPDHPHKGSEILRERGVAEHIRRAILSHVPDAGVSRDTPMEKALFACDELCGFIVACAVVRPNKLADLEASSVKKKMKDKAFARAVRREDIVEGAAGLGVELDAHVAFVIQALRGIAGELGLER
jgi:putative nucleotidyltransferase with HDIG domain